MNCLKENLKTNLSFSTGDCPGHWLRERIVTEANEVQMSAQFSNCASALTAAIDHLTSAKLILKLEATIKTTSDHNATPHNAKISTQRYHSTRKKRQRLVHALVKPTDEEVKRIKLDMSNTYSVCFREDPPEIQHHTGQHQVDREDDGEVIWVECSHCHLWFHLLCVGDIDCSEDFMCCVCKRTRQ